MQVTVWTPVLLLTAFLAFGLSVYVFVRYFDGDRALVAAFVGISFGGGWWALTYALHLSSTTLSGKLFWLQFVWFGPALLMVAWPAFVLLYTGHNEWVREPRLMLLLLAPFTILAVVWGGGMRSLMYVDAAVETIGGMELLTFTQGPFLALVVMYSLFLNLMVSVLLLGFAVRSSERYRRPATFLLAAGLLPALANILSTTQPIVSPFLDLTPIAFAITTPMVGWVLVRYRLLEVAPIARNILFTDLSDGVVVVGDDGEVAEMNDAARNLLGEVDGRRAETAFEQHPALLSLVQGEVPQTSARVTVETNGATSVFEVAASTFTRRGVTGTVLLFTDVTNQETLQHRYRTLVEQSPNVIMTVDREGAASYVSPSIERLLGYEPGAFTDDRVQVYVHPEDRGTFERHLRRSGTDGESSLLELRFYHADGAVRRFKTTFKQLHDEFLLVATDITEQHRYRQRLQVLNRILRHDLKNNVNVIQLNAELLDDHVDEDGTRYLDPIRRKADALGNLSDIARDIDYLLSKQSATQMVDVVEAVEEAVERLQHTYPEATVRVDTPEERFVLLDALYPSMLDNLLENAVEHNDQPEPRIDITVDEREEVVELRIADNGPGLPPDERQVIQSEQETPLEHTSGLGLWLSKWIVSSAGGEMTFEENEPRGTIICLELRRERAATASTYTGRRND